VGGQGHGLVGPRSGSNAIAIGLRAVRQGQGGPYRAPAQADPTVLDPSLDFRQAGHMEACQKVAAVERQRARRIVLGQGLLEGDEVGHQVARDQSDALGAISGQDCLTHVTPEHRQRLSQSVAGAGLVKLRPEDGEQRVATTAFGSGEIGEQHEALGL